MKHLALTLAAGISAVAFSASAMAADLAADFVPVPTAAASDPYDWSGLHVGVFGDAGLLRSSVPGENASNVGSTNGNVSLTGTGGGMGATIGASMQTGSFYLGVDGDIAWEPLHSSTTFDPDFWTSTLNWNWLATLRAKAGVVVDRAAIYATAGAAFINSTAAACYNANCDPADASDFTHTQTALGVAVGVGAELAMTDNISLKGEVLYVAAPATDIIAYLGDTAHFESSAVIARVGLNFRFD